MRINHHGEPYMAQEKGLSFQVLQMIDDQIFSKRITIHSKKIIALIHKKTRSASIWLNLKVYKFVHIIKTDLDFKPKFDQSFSRKVNSPSSEVILIFTLR